MAPHLTGEELDFMFAEAAKGTAVKEIHEKLKRWRAKHKQSGLDRPRRPEAGFPTSGGWLWDVPFSIRVYSKHNDFGPPAIQGPPDGFPASAGRVGRRLDFRFRAGGSGILRP